MSARAGSPIDPDTLLDLALEVANSAEPRDVIRRILERGLTLAGADRGSLTSFHGDSFVIEAAVQNGAEVEWSGRSFAMPLLLAQPLIKQALAERRPILNGTLDLAAVAPDLASAATDVRHAAFVPIFERDQLMGMLTFARFNGPAFDASHMPSLKALGGLAGLALRTARSHEESTADARRTQAALDAATDVGDAHELPELLERVITSAHRAVGADSAGVLSLSDDGGVMEATSGVTAVGSRWPMRPEVLAAIRAGETLRHGPEDVKQWNRGELFSGIYSDVILTPLRFDGQSHGMLAVARNLAREPFTDADVASLTQFASLAALLVTNARLLTEVRTSERRKREFIDMFVHELRNPLTVISGYSELLTTGAIEGVPTAALETLNVINEKATEASGLVADLLTLARVESGDLHPVTVNVTMADVVRDAVLRSEARIRLTGGSISWHADASLCVRGDANLIARIIDNLIVNAQTYVTDVPSIHVVAVADSDDVLVSVVDNGIGVPAGERVAIFNRYFRGASTDAHQGTGLGLYVSRECARLMGGDLILESSEPGVGSRFVLRLPHAGPASDR